MHATIPDVAFESRKSDRMQTKKSGYVRIHILCLFFLALPLAAQELGERERLPIPPTPVIDGFAVMGNETTKPEIILRELSLRVGDTIDIAEIEYAKSRIYSLGLFNRVDITWPPLDSTILLIEVDERWYLYPVIITDIVDRDWNKWNFGLGVKHDNLRGRNERLFAGGAIGFNPWASVSYANPWVMGDEALFTESSLGYSSIENKSRALQGEGPNFREIHIAGFQTVGKRLSPYHSIWMNLGYAYVQVTENQQGRTIAPEGIDRYVSIGMGARHDTRNLTEYPTSGVFGAVSISKVGVGIGAVDMLSYSGDIRVYAPLYGELSLALRAFTRLSSGPAVPPYRHNFFGFSERIRGHFRTEREGENIAGAFAELRIPIVPRIYVFVPEVPVRQFRTWKLGLYGALFFDTGTVWNKRHRPFAQVPPRGYGAGLHFLFPYGTVLRIDRAWDEQQRGEWILDIGASF
ncbi:MAG: BamA/TamA family outer membrane protein [Bacteroidetes bacterium]|nr:BamA/TamA family outer membrane protein [Bacteroidota bacterium]